MNQRLFPSSVTTCELPLRKEQRGGEQTRDEDGLLSLVEFPLRESGRDF